MSLIETLCHGPGVLHTSAVPKLWSDTIDSHRRAVRETVLAAAGTLVAERGLRSVTMSEVALRAGIGRATLYKYFPDLSALLREWHERQVGLHLDRLVEIGKRPGPPRDRLADVLHAYAAMIRDTGRHDAELAAFLHHDGHVTSAEARLSGLLRELLTEAAATGAVRSDVAADELAIFCRNALQAARGLASPEAVARLVSVVLAGLGTCAGSPPGAAAVPH